MHGPYGCLAIRGEDKFKFVFVTNNYYLDWNMFIRNDTTKSVSSESLSFALTASPTCSPCHVPCFFKLYFIHLVKFSLLSIHFVSFLFLYQV